MQTGVGFRKSADLIGVTDSPSAQSKRIRVFVLQFDNGCSIEHLVGGAYWVTVPGARMKPRLFYSMRGAVQSVDGYRPQGVGLSPESAARLGAACHEVAVEAAAKMGGTR